MNKKRMEDGKLTNKAKGLGTVDEAMVRQRARELALIKGRAPSEVLDSDLEEARQELTREQTLDPQPTAAETIPEEDRWPGNPGTGGKRAETVPAPDEQTAAEKLVQEGVEEAEHDQMVRATRAALEKDKQE